MTKKIMLCAAFCVLGSSALAAGCMGVEPEESAPVSDREPTAGDEEIGEAQQEVQGASCTRFSWPEVACTGRNAENETCCAENPLSNWGTCTDVRFDEDNCGSCNHECVAHWVDGFLIGGTCINGICM